MHELLGYVQYDLCLITSMLLPIRQFYQGSVITHRDTANLLRIPLLFYALGSEPSSL